MLPPNPDKHAHAFPRCLFELTTLQGAGVQVGAMPGQGLFMFIAEHVIVGAPLSTKPSLQLKVATLPCWLPLLFRTLPLAGELALVPVHWNLISVMQERPSTRQGPDTDT